MFVGKLYSQNKFIPNLEEGDWNAERDPFVFCSFFGVIQIVGTYASGCSC